MKFHEFDGWVWDGGRLSPIWHWVESFTPKIYVKPKASYRPGHKGKWVEVCIEYAKKKHKEKRSK